MTASRASKRSAAKKPSRGLDDSPSRRTRSQTLRDRLCRLLLSLDPAAISRAVKVLDAYGVDRSSSQSLAHETRLVVKHVDGHRTGQGKLKKIRKPVTSRLRSSSNTPGAFRSGGIFGPSSTSNAPCSITTAKPFGWSPTFNTPNPFMASSSGNALAAFPTVKSFGWPTLNAPPSFTTPKPFESSTTDTTPTATFNMTSAFVSNNMYDPLSTFVTINRASRAEVLFASAEDIRRFNDKVLIIKGDIGSITHLNNRKIDGIAFPTTSNLRNSGTGTAAAIFRRAGDELSTYVEGLPGFPYYGAGAARVTPGFGAGVKKLIHAVGPSATHRYYYKILEATYRNVMEAAESERVKCLAVSSISTGRKGAHPTIAALAALRAIGEFLPKDKWPGVVGIVCYEQKVFDAFKHEKQAMIEAANHRLQ